MIIRAIYRIALWRLRLCVPMWAMNRQLRKLARVIDEIDYLRIKKERVRLRVIETADVVSLLSADTPDLSRSKKFEIGGIEGTFLK